MGKLTVTFKNYDNGQKHLGKLYINKREDTIVLCNRNALPDSPIFAGTIIATTNPFNFTGQEACIVNNDSWRPFSGVLKLEQS